jgi:transposase
MIPDVAPRRPAGPRGPSLGRLRLAAKLCYVDELTDEAIARRLGISRRTLARWKQRPEFQAAYQRQDERFQAALAAEWLGAWLAERERPAADNAR